MESEPSDSEEGDHLGLGPIPSVLPTTTHIVTFKCIGTLYEQSRQEALKRAADLIDLGESVQVKLVPEPDNPYDSKAISFQCKVDSKWCLIGYAVSGGLGHVAPSGGSGDLAPSGSGDLAPSGGSGDLGPSGGSGDLAPSGGSGDLAASGGLGHVAPSGGSGDLQR